MTPRTTRSSLTDHCFPAFYACYLLKSVRTARATATYIGSTPSPPRRIRQHNGEISQGAWKTKHNRPWVMQMIVHGFPSKLAALQFEWAWQHPHISRHLRDNDGNAMFTGGGRFKYLNANVKVARSMVSSHPYNTWPLSVTIFTEEAEKAWLNSNKDAAMPPLPPGIKVTTELEAVDGKSGKTGTGRCGPIDVMDTQFTSGHLQKASAVFSPNQHLECSICHEEIVENDDPLTIALCPTNACQAVSHLRCLSGHFLSSQPSTSSDIIPRGGTCTACHSYILWGDVIRGCYRRHKGGVVPENEPEAPEDREDGLDDSPASKDGDTEEVERARAVAKSTQRPRSKKAPTRRVPSASQAAPYSTSSRPAVQDEQEHVDLDIISSCDEEDSDDELPWARHPVRQQPLVHRGGPHSEAYLRTGNYPAPTLSEHSHPSGSHAPHANFEDRDGNSMPSTAAAAGRTRSNPSQISKDGISQRPRSMAQAKTVPLGLAESKAGLANRASRAETVRTTPQPFPDLPSLSQPPRLVSGLGKRAEPPNTEIVEISD
ncbi:hypothetical protein FKP32DRAFT_1656902 [Trametes sanguinea]|nr:hypothetical protein FKP32DRAFT_1656902 [Trametes sanguinea]